MVKFKAMKEGANMRDEEFIKLVAERLVHLRNKYGYTASEVARASGKSLDAYYAYEAGRRMVSADVLYNLSSFYKISIDEIIDSDVTYNRSKTVSFDVAGTDAKIKISSENDDILFFKIDDWTYEYYLKTNVIELDKKVLIKKDGSFFPGTVAYNDKIKAYSIYSYTTSSMEIVTKASFMKNYLIVGIYAGRIDKQVDIKNFL